METEVKEPNKKLKVKINKYSNLLGHFSFFNRWQSVAIWKWDVNDDACSICRMPFDAHCDKCKRPGDECPPSNYLIHLELI
jgi:hypothetical protein